MSETPVAILGINLCWLAWQPHALSLELLLVLKKKINQPLTSIFKPGCSIYGQLAQLRGRMCGSRFLGKATSISMGTKNMLIFLESNKRENPAKFLCSIHTQNPYIQIRSVWRMSSPEARFMWSLETTFLDTTRSLPIWKYSCLLLILSTKKT